MTRFPAKEPGETTMEFEVADKARIGHPDGSGRMMKGGDIIPLTKHQAEFLMKRGLINVALPDFEPQLNFDAITTSDDGNQSEKSAGDKADGPGDLAAGNSSGSDDVSTKGKVSSGRGRKDPL